jgi:hypothetical protein
LSENEQMRTLITHKKSKWHFILPLRLLKLLKLSALVSFIARERGRNVAKMCCNSKFRKLKRNFTCKDGDKKQDFLKRFSANWLI